MASLAVRQAGGSLDRALVGAALQELSADIGPIADTGTLLSVLGSRTGPAAAALARHIEERRHRAALEWHEAHARGAVPAAAVTALLDDLPRDLPVGWRTRAASLRQIANADRALRDWLLVAPWSLQVPTTCEMVRTRYQEAVRGAQGPPSAWTRELVERLIDEARGEVQAHLDSFAAASPGAGDPVLSALPVSWSEIERELRAALDRFIPVDAPLVPGVSALTPDTLLVQADDGFVDELVAVVAASPNLSERAARALTARFGEPGCRNWNQWRAWLDDHRAATVRLEQSLHDREKHGAVSLVLNWFAGLADPDIPIIDSLTALAGAIQPAGELADFVFRWKQVIPPDELAWLVARLAPSREAPPISGAPPIPEARPISEVVVPTSEPAVPTAVTGRREAVTQRGAQLWNEHLRPFVLENWYMVAGVLMVLVGASLLAYYTWDRHWLIRYTIMPVLLAAFTAGLAGLGSWIEHRSDEFRDTAAVLRGAAILLLPVNFMTVAVLADDANVTQKTAAVAFLSMLYLVGFGRGLGAWCGAVEVRLAPLLGRTLLLLNALVLMAPLSRVLPQPPWIVDAGGIGLFIAVGFYAGFLRLGFVANTFCRLATVAPSRSGPVASADATGSEDVDTVEAISGISKRVSWFFGVALFGTFLQVFLWVHGFLALEPDPALYAFMVLGAGVLVLDLERTLHRGDRGLVQQAESFLGYALVILAILMGSGQEILRGLVLAGAGLAWMRHGNERRVVHAWIGLMLISLAVASLALLAAFPRGWEPILGFVVFGGLAAVGPLAAARRRADLVTAAEGLRMAALGLTAVVAILAQWHYESAPLRTAGFLVVTAALFVGVAVRRDRLTWLQTGMMVLALALPYLGCVDFTGPAFRGNSLVFGLGVLAILWLTACRVLRIELLARARSTVVLLYGLFAMAAMLLRVFVERRPAGDPLSSYVVLDFVGPLFMTGALAAAAWHARSYLPAALAVILAAVLLPGMRTHLQAMWPALAWGSGLGTGVNALVLLAVAAVMASRPGLQELDGGDPFWGRGDFPWREASHRVISTPLRLAAVLLVLRVDILAFARNVDLRGLPPKTAIALVLSGLAWMMIANAWRVGGSGAWGTYVGWFWIAAGVALGLHRNTPGVTWWGSALAVTVLLQFVHLALLALKRRYPLLGVEAVTPTRRIVEGVAMVGSLAALLAFLSGSASSQQVLLAAFFALQLPSFSLALGRRRYAVLFFLLITGFLIELARPGQGVSVNILLDDRFRHALFLYLAALLVLDLWPDVDDDLARHVEPLARPLRSLSAIAVVLLALIFAGDFYLRAILPAGDRLLLLGALLLAARAEGFPPLLLGAAFLAYPLVVGAGDPFMAGRPSLLRAYFAPLSLSAFAGAIVIVGSIAPFLASAMPGWFASRRATPALTGPAAPWFLTSGLFVATIAVLGIVADSGFRAERIQYAAPYVAAAAVLLVARQGWRLGPPQMAVLFFTLGHYLLLQHHEGERLGSWGLSSAHVASLAVLVTLATFSIVRRVVTRADVVDWIESASLVLAALVLAFLSVHYVGHPDIAAISTHRFIISGLSALAAGLYCRHAARLPGARHAAGAEMAYHFGVTVAIWSAALLVPAMRNPSTVLAALGLPALYFLARAELDSGHRAPYRNSSAVLLGILLFLYLFRTAFQLTLFPEAPIETHHYHTNAPVVIVAGLALLRLHALGGHRVLASFAGLAVMLGSYFAVTWLPGLSPFRHPIPGAWAAIACGFFWTLVTVERSPLRTGLQGLGGLDAAAWEDERRDWGRFLAAAAQAATWWGMFHAQEAPRQVAPLLAAAALLLVYHGVLRERTWYFAVAGAELLLALHMDFFVSSVLDRQHILWVFLLVQVLNVVAHARWPTRWSIDAAHAVGVVAILGTCAHILYHHPASRAGLAAAGATILVALLLPVRSREPRGALGEAVAQMPLLGALWVLFWSQTSWPAPWLIFAGLSWPFLAVMAGVATLGALASHFRSELAERYAGWPRPRPVLGDRLLGWMGREAESFLQKATLFVTVSLVLLQVAHYGSAFPRRDFLVMLILYAFVGTRWFRATREWTGGISHVAVHAVCWFAAILVRRQLVLTLAFWTPQYDVWASLAVSILLTGLKRQADHVAPSGRWSYVASLFALPFLALSWTLWHGLGPRVALVVVGAHSLMFAQLGSDRRDSPYNIVAIGGFVSFVCLVFWSELQLRAIHAYIIPVGCGILGLQQLYAEHMSPAARGQVRFVTMLSMIASTAWYAILDDRYPLAFHLTLVLVSLASMGLGGALRVRLYVVLGFVGLVIDLLAILYRALYRLERAQQMTAVGALVLVMGTALIGAAVVYKTHRVELAEAVQRLRKQLRDWE